MLRLALTPRWLGWFLLVVLASLACLWLGQWQWGRYEDRSARAERIESHYEADPVPVTEVLTDDPVAIDDEWTRVRATGSYDTGHQVLVRNRPLDGTYGYEVLLPLRLEGGGTLLVDRGWVPNSPKGADVAPDVPPAPDGTVTVTGPGEITVTASKSGEGPWTGREWTITRTAVARLNIGVETGE